MRVYDPAGPHHDRVVDLLLTGGQLTIDPTDAPDAALRVEAEGLSVSLGWADVGAGVGEPGHEQRETVRSLQAAALAGGYTHVLVKPETEPAIASRSDVEAFRSRAAEHPVDLDVIGSLVPAGDHGRLAELGDMAAAGVRFFALPGDGPVEDPKLLSLALAYAGQLGATVVTRPGVARLSDDGLMHEGAVSTQLGVPGVPAFTEAVGVQRDLAIRDYRGGRLHFDALSTASALAHLDGAGRDEVTYGVPILNLLLDDAAMRTYDADLKVEPVLRAASDRERLRAAVRAGDADVLVSNHRPRTLEDKRVEFAYAEFGAATLEDAFGVACAAVGGYEPVVDYLARRNRLFLGLACPAIASGVTEPLTLFQAAHTYQPAAVTRATLGRNTPRYAEPLRGRAFGIIREAQLHYAQP